MQKSWSLTDWWFSLFLFWKVYSDTKQISAPLKSAAASRFKKTKHDWDPLDGWWKGSGTNGLVFDGGDARCSRFRCLVKERHLTTLIRSFWLTVWCSSLLVSRLLFYNFDTDFDMLPQSQWLWSVTSLVWPYPGFTPTGLLLQLPAFINVIHYQGWTKQFKALQPPRKKLAVNFAEGLTFWHQMCHQSQIVQRLTVS